MSGQFRNGAGDSSLCVSCPDNTEQIRTVGNSRCKVASSSRQGDFRNSMLSVFIHTLMRVIQVFMRMWWTYTDTSWFRSLGDINVTGYGPNLDCENYPGIKL